MHSHICYFLYRSFRPPFMYPARPKSANFTIIRDAGPETSTFSGLISLCTKFFSWRDLRPLAMLYVICWTSWMDARRAIMSKTVYPKSHVFFWQDINLGVNNTDFHEFSSLLLQDSKMTIFTLGIHSRRRHRWSPWRNSPKNPTTLAWTDRFKNLASERN